MKYERGITLIALILTVIILLILAEISIGLLIGDNSIVTKASDSVLSSREAKAAEEIELALSSVTTKFYTEWAFDTSKNIADFMDPNNLNEYIKETGHITRIDSNGDGTYTVDYQAIDQNMLYTFSVSYDGKTEFIEKTDLQNPTPLTTKLSLDQILDLERSPAFPAENDSISMHNFKYPYNYHGAYTSSAPLGTYFRFTKLGNINSLYDEDLKQQLQSTYPGKDYSVVRLDMYNKKNELIGHFSTGGILYLLDEEKGIYLFLAAHTSEANNSYGYLICLDHDEAVRIRGLSNLTLTVQDIVENVR